MKSFKKLKVIFCLVLGCVLSICFGRNVFAISQYSPNGGVLTVGQERAISATNMGSWRGALDSDNIYWGVDNNVGGTGVDMEVYFAGVVLRSATKRIITMEIDNDSTSLQHYVQIYDNAG